MNQGACPTPCSFVVFTLNSHWSLLKSLGMCQNVRPKVINTHLYIIEKETKQETSLESTHHIPHHGSPCESTCTIKWQRLFTWLFMCDSMHIDAPKTFHMNYHVWLNAHWCVKNFLDELSCVTQCTLMRQKLFTWIIMCDSMHIDAPKTFHMNYHVWLNAHWCAKNFSYELSCVTQCTLLKLCPNHYEIQLLNK
jgi:hypothetical protein